MLVESFERFAGVVPAHKLEEDRRVISRNRFLFTVLAVAILIMGSLLVGCGDETTTIDDTEKTDTASNDEQTGGEKLYVPEYKPNGGETATIKTNKGVITVEFFGDDAPIHVGNFIELAQKGFYDGIKFHRYIPGFVVQGGDPDTKEATSEQVAAEAAKGDGYGRFGAGGPGYTIQDEYDPAVNPNKHVQGTLSMARTMMPNSAGSQFYFVLATSQANSASLDGQYTAFGQVTEGMDVLLQLRAGDVIESVTINGAK